VRLFLEAPRTTWSAGDTVTVRLVVFNDGYEPVAFDRRRLVGPNFGAGGGAGPLPMPMAVEPGFEEEAANHVVLNPFCLYGRERSAESVPAGEITAEGFLLAKPLEALGDEGVAAPDAVALRAEPLTLRVG
jgi:hypothetical protein